MTINIIKRIFSLLSSPSIRIRKEVLYLLEALLDKCDDSMFHLIIFELEAFKQMNKIFDAHSECVSNEIVQKYLDVLEVVFKRMMEFGKSDDTKIRSIQDAFVK